MVDKDKLQEYIIDKYGSIRRFVNKKELGNYTHIVNCFKGNRIFSEKLFNRIMSAIEEEYAKYSVECKIDRDFFKKSL